MQFPWQKPTGETTPWIRVVTPHGGGDKGFHFIPEVGEEVLIGFEGANAERPYMMGSCIMVMRAQQIFKVKAMILKLLEQEVGILLS
ncbi:phage baseplate assembly protein V [Algibacter lectus]|uniref:VgrG protein n=1 Tax=Algibacter lectus TaxID=221126 RepID=A0A090WBV6_9FLAO|nr:phage baseplate assembly protein V [Algibacter lectus]GAL64992.1 VgrG protein [Algibacter lectus]